MRMPRLLCVSTYVLYMFYISFGLLLTEWPSPTGCLTFSGLFMQKRPIISVQFVERDPTEKVAYGFARGEVYGLGVVRLRGVGVWVLRGLGI